MRMMGADSVDCHGATVLARGDDHAGQALAYYGHRCKPVVERLSARGEPPTMESVAPDGTIDTLTLRFHDLRHTCVALLIAKGAQQYEVMEHLGHTNIQAHINTYGHLFPNVRERIRVALEDTWEEGRRSAG
ncbi:MAG: tyrosine-type recombinase/integrase [Actinomycetota bacterium]|nr:tyrosine-type recombinase/integrase [Actinomycetota bacterium]